MKTFKVGDRVQMNCSYRDWLIKTVPENYSVKGVYSKQSDSELLALFASREFDKPLRGTVDRIGEDEPGIDTVHASFSNEFGTYVGYVRFGNVIKLKKVVRCKNCGSKK